MEKVRLFFSVLFLIAALIIILLLAIFDNTVFFRAADLIKNYMWPAGIALVLFLILLSSGVVSNAADYKGPLFSNGLILLAIVELFLFSAGLVYLRYYSQQPGQIVLRLQPESTRNFVNLGMTHQSSVAMDTVRAPDQLINQAPGKYSFEILDQDLVYYRTELKLKPAGTETLVIPIALNSKTLAVQTEPSGAEIWINGIQASHTPDSFDILTGDTAILELKLPGYAVFTDTFSLIENVDLGIIPLRKLYTLWISGLYAYSQYSIYDEEDRIVFSSNGSRKTELPQGRYRISFEIGEGQFRSKTFSLNYNTSVHIP